MNAPRIETDRLILTWPTTEQIDQYYNDIIGTNMFDTIIWEGPENGASDLHNYWQESKKNDLNDLSIALNFVVINKETDECMGGCSLRPVDGDHRVIDVGFAFAPKFHGNGYATEAIRAIVNEAFTNREAVRVFGKVFVGNTASRRVFEKLGFQLEGTLRSIICKRDKWLDEWLFACLKDEWKN